MAFERMRIFTGNANPKLAAAVCKHASQSVAVHFETNRMPMGPRFRLCLGGK